MIKFKAVSIQRGAKVLLENINLTIQAKHKVGIVGANGCGKSSLLKAILGELETSKGDIELPNGLRMTCLLQETPALSQPAMEYVLAGDKVLAKLYQALARAEHEQDMDAMMSIYTQMGDLDAYSAQARAAKILHGLGFSDDDFTRSVAEFSGGWRMRLNLAQCLMAPADVILLDEPTNHLDLAAIIWLEKWLQRFDGSVIVISHDREFLDDTVDQILHIENHTIKKYSGNYSAFEELRANALAVHESRYEKQQTEIKHMMSYVNRFRYKSSKAKQAQSRLKAIGRMENLIPLRAQSPFRFQFAEPEKVPNPVFQFEKAAIGFDETTLIEKLKLKFNGDARIGLLGKNGCGKSTLLRTLVGDYPLLAGQLHIFNGVKLAYYEQHQVDSLKLTNSAYDHLMEIATQATTQEIRDFLGGFAFHGDHIFSPVADFSGGEKARLALALIVWQRPNLLLLDEPSNHLDMEMREALCLALQSYVGALIIVSHDRHLLRNCVNDLWLIEEGKLIPFEGDVDDYAAIMA